MNKPINRLPTLGDTGLEALLQKYGEQFEIVLVTNERKDMKRSYVDVQCQFLDAKARS